MAKKKPQGPEEVVRILKGMRVMLFPNSQGQVESLDLRAENTTDETLQVLDQLPGLKRLCLQGTHITNVGLEHLSVIGSLEELDLRSCKKITDQGMKHVSRMLNLKGVKLNDTLIGDRGLESLSALTNLDALGIHSTRVTDGGLQFVTRFARLKSLELGGGSLTDDALRHFELLKELEWLILSESRFTDAALVHLKDLVRLKLLYIAWTPITGSGFKHLAKLTRLENVHAVESQFTDEGLKYLAPLKGLKSLGLSGTKVTDKGLNYIQGLSKLKSLGLEKTKVTRQGKAKLKIVLPRCVITISADQADTRVDDYDAEYFWNNPPRCVAGFTLKALRQEPVSTFQLICGCGGETGEVLGYRLSAYRSDWTGPELVSPLSFRCHQCQKVTEIIDTDIHGYDGEIGSPVNIQGKGKRVAFQCPSCMSDEMSVTVHFQCDGGELDLKRDEPTIAVQDFFGWFQARGLCSKCQSAFSIADFELA
jgi:hypothetical protein